MRSGRNIRNLGILAAASILAVCVFAVMKYFFGPAPVQITPLPGERRSEPLALQHNAYLNADLVFSEAVTDALIVVGADNIELDCGGHKISGSARLGIKAHFHGNLRIRRCVLEGTATGVQIMDGSGFTIRDTAFRVRERGVDILHATGVDLKNVSVRPFPNERADVGINVFQSADICVQDCRMKDLAQGILFYSTQRFQARGNIIERIVETGIGMFHDTERRGCSDGAVTGNTIRNALMGVEIFCGSSRVTVERNAFEDCNMGVRIDDKFGYPEHNAISDVLVKANAFARNLYPIDYHMKDQGVVRVEKNAISP
jgi:nitrous oxidase accessory protein NosD